MDTLPREIINEVLLKVDKLSLFYCSFVCRQWRELALNTIKFPISESDLKQGFYDQNVLLITHANLSEEWRNFVLLNGSLFGFYELVKYILYKGLPDNIILNQAFVNGCQRNHKQIINLMIKYGANDWNKGFYYACRNKDVDTAKDMIARGADNFDIIDACVCDSIELVYILIEHGVKQWNEGMISASELGNIEIVKEMIKRGADNWNEGLIYAAFKGHTDIVKLMIDNGADDFNEALILAAENHIDIVELLIKHSNIDIDILNKALANACRKGNTEIIKLLITHGANEFEWPFLLGCMNGQAGVINLLIDNGAEYWDQGLFHACINNHVNVAQLMITKGATDFNESFKAASERCHIECMKLLIPYVDINFNYCLEQLLLSESDTDENKILETVSFLINCGADNFAKCAKIAKDMDLPTVQQLLEDQHN